MTKQTDNNLICCPEFKPELWDDKILEWHNKKFIKDSVFTIFFMPVNFGAVMRRIDNKVRKADASTPDFLCLADHVSRWKMDVYLAVDKDIPNANNIVLRNLHNGCIILLHAVSKDNADALDSIIKGARERGYEFGKFSN